MLMQSPEVLHVYQMLGVAAQPWCYFSAFACTQGSACFCKPPASAAFQHKVVISHVTQCCELCF